MNVRAAILIASFALLSAGCMRPQTQTPGPGAKPHPFGQTKKVEPPSPSSPTTGEPPQRVIIHAPPPPAPAPAPAPAPVPQPPPVEPTPQLPKAEAPPPVVQPPPFAPAPGEPTPNEQVRRRFWRAGISGWWDRKVQQGRRWTDFTAKALDEVGEILLAKVPEDMNEWCPGFKKLDRDARKSFWVHFISAMAVFESSFNTQAKHREKFNDRNGDPVVSRGLLQLSVESAQGFGCNWIEKSQDLHDPELNLKCGVKILNRHVGSDNRVFGQNVDVGGGRVAKWMGAPRYWGIFRLTNVRGAIQRAVTRLKICQATPEDAQNTHQIQVQP